MDKTDLDNYFNMETEVLIIIKEFIDNLLKIENKYKTTTKKIDNSKLTDEQLTQLLSKYYDTNVLSMLLVSGNKAGYVKEQMQNYNDLTTKEKKELIQEITALIKQRDIIGVKK